MNFQVITQYFLLQVIVTCYLLVFNPFDRFTTHTTGCTCSYLQFSWHAFFGGSGSCLLVFFSCLVCDFFQNILVSCYHIFVCPRRSWNSAANDNDLWKMNYSLFFGLCHLSCNSIPVSGVQKSCELVQSSIISESIDPNFRWKESFHSTYAGSNGIPLFAYYSIQPDCTIPWLSSKTGVDCILLQNVHHGNLHQIEHYVGIADQLFGWATWHVLLHTIAVGNEEME